MGGETLPLAFGGKPIHYTHNAMDLSNYMLIDISTGTMLTAEHCRLVHDSELSGSEWEELDTMSDSETGELARERGVRLDPAPVLDQIASILSGRDWDPELLEQIAEIVRGTGRIVDDIY